MTSTKGPGVPETIDGQGLRIAIVHARWNSHIVNPLVQGALQSLKAGGVQERDIKVVSVPGSWELPTMVQHLGRQFNEDRTPPQVTTHYHAIIAIGVLIKGETMHFEHVAEAASQGLMRVQLDICVPVIFGLLTVQDETHALDRAGLATAQSSHNHGLDWGTAAVEMGYKLRRLES
ncbi:MAG: hypothetical protein M1829_003832 [Trizodia sp. TS-e1964]|nr:MAG: hypothetical protein M1829_003832 [Trizodia sp. TS-e1964]